MVNNYIKNLSVIFLLFVLIGTSSEANSINISQHKQISLLENSSVYFDEKHLSIQEIVRQNLFNPNQKPYINIGISSKTIWVTFTLKNESNTPLDKILVMSAPFIEHIALYKESNYANPVCKGVSDISKQRTTLFPFYHIHLAPHTAQQYYLEVSSKLNPVDFKLWLDDENSYRKKDISQQLINILLMGIVLALMLYSLFVSLYTKDKSYFYYSLYLFTLIYHQMTYLGLTQIYFPVSFIHFDIQIPMIKANILIITAALFAMYFLRTKHIQRLHRIYKVFIFISLADMVVRCIFDYCYLDTVLLTGVLFVLFTLIAGIISYKKGNKQARLFIVGFSIVFASYILIILNAISLTSIMQDFQNLLMFSTAFEALILSLAFADRYTVLQQEKEEVDQHILDASKNREKIVREEVIKKTALLNQALETKEMLLQEVHHRVKNNLQVILSMIRLQNDKIEDQAVMEKFINLENRINAIAKTYDMLLIKDNLEEIDMQEYIDSLLWDIQETINYESHQISIKTDIDAMIPLRESVYIGLIINELVTNAYKYAFDDHKGTISISLHHDKNDFILTVEDDGKGFIVEENNKTLGLKLIHTLVYDQLRGNMEIFTNNYTKYIIRFTI